MSTTLAIKYRPTTFEDVVGQSSTKAILENQLVTNTIKNAYLFCGSAGTGKAQPLYSKVLTPSGFVSMGDIMVGDEVFTHSGRITQVTAVYPQGKRDIYEITLQDRTCIRVADNHLNSVYRYNQCKKCREDYVLTTLDLIKFMNKSKYKLRVDVPKVDWDEKPVLINPYLLGILIGDGSLSNNLSLSNVESDIIYKADMILHKEYNMKLTSQNNKDYKICYITNPKHNSSKGDRGLHKLVRNYNPIETLKGQLASYGLLCKSTEKHIPKEYLLNSESIRLALLQGLFDTDGFTEKNGCTSFTTSSKQLSDDFEFLVRSLGIRDTVSSAPSSYIKGGIKHTCTTHYTHYLHMPKNLKYCTSKKHLSRYKNRQNEPIRNIESIKYIGKELCQCIMVEDDDHTYISDSFIPTHNTTCARIFANEINKHNGIPIEIDAASHSSVNDVREIVNQAQTKSIDGEYKIFIIDECFPANTLIDTPNGQKPICELHTGDTVYSMCGCNKVTHLFKNKVVTNRLCCVIINNRKIITTVDHLFFTNNGWMMAKDLKKGDIVYDNKDLQELWKTIHTKSGQGDNFLLQSLCHDLSLRTSTNGTEATNKTNNTTLSSVWKSIYNKGNRGEQTQNLLKEMRNRIRYESICTMGEFRFWDGTSETVIRKNEAVQPNEERTMCSNNAEYKREERYTASMESGTGWKWEVHNSTDSLVRSLRRWLGIRICNKYQKSEPEGTSTTLVLQSRPWLSINEDCSRGRWQKPQVEKWVIKRLKERKLSESVRVESVEIYKRGYNDELFRDSFTDTELSQETVIMYDLEVENDHSYFVNNILVHNCHSLSTTGWQAFLKLLEEPPAKTIFIFATTDPQKIPKTILSRVQRYNFQKISNKDIYDRLVKIIDEENDGISYEDEALSYITKLANGGMRDAITMLDKCISYNNHLTLNSVVEALNKTNPQIMVELCEALLCGEKRDIIEIIEEVHNSGADLKIFVKEFTDFLLDVCKYMLTNSFEYTIYLSEYNKNWLNSITSSFDLITSFLDKMTKLNSDIKYSDNPKYVVEATLILLGGE